MQAGCVANKINQTIKFQTTPVMGKKMSATDENVVENLIYEPQTYENTKWAWDDQLSYAGTVGEQRDGCSMHRSGASTCSRKCVWKTEDTK